MLVRDNIRIKPIIYYHYACPSRIDEKGVIKVSDFGLTEDIYTQNYYRQEEKSSIKLPLKWMALESIQRGIFSEKTDVVSTSSTTCSNVHNYIIILLVVIWHCVLGDIYIRKKAVFYYGTKKCHTTFGERREITLSC